MKNLSVFAIAVVTAVSTLAQESAPPSTPAEQLGWQVDLLKLVTIIRRVGYRGYLPIETLASGRKNYDSFAEVAKMLVQLREAIAATESIAPQPSTK